MNAMINKLLQGIFSERPDFVCGEFEEADSYLYGDGMGWTCLTMSLNCDAEQELKPAGCPE